MNPQMNGRHVVITGGTGALGSGVVPRFLKAGAICHVVSNDARNPFDQANVHFHGEVRLDREADVVALYESLPEAPWASLHLVGGFTMGALTDTPLASFEKMLSLNAVTAFLCCREAVRRMQPAGGGRIVNVVARPVLEPAAQLTAYAASKAAVLALTQSLAAEVRDQNILVNAVAPSIIDSEANRQAMPDAPHDRWPKPEELAHTLAWLASPENTLTSGACVPVYGRA